MQTSNKRAAPRAPRPSALEVRAHRRPARRRSIAPYLFISPFYILFAIFFIFPVGFSVVLSFSSWDEVGPLKLIGGHNYTRLLSDSTYHTVVINTIIYILGSLVISFLLSLPLAVALNNRHVRGKPVLRALYFSPIVTPAVAVAVVFNILFNKQPGTINSILHVFGIGAVPWLESTSLSKLVVLILVAWQWTGLNMLYFLAGLQAVSPSLREAALLDGASSWRINVSVVLPNMRPMLLFVLVTTFIGSSQIFDQPFVLTAGGPINSSLSYANYIYQQGLSNLNFGYASAMGVVLLVIIGIIGWVQYQRLGAR